jgi:predicted amidohydrolase
MDVAITLDKVARLAPDFPASQARLVIHAEGKIVTPGLIDCHAHVFPYVGPYGVQVDPYSVHRGVTTVVDAEPRDISHFRRPLLHIAVIGMVCGSTRNVGELLDLRYCVPRLTVERATPLKKPTYP